MIERQSAGKFFRTNAIETAPLPGLTNADRARVARQDDPTLRGADTSPKATTSTGRCSRLEREHTHVLA